MSASLVDDVVNLYKACQIGRDGMEDSAKVWKKTPALIEIMPRLSPDCVHHEIRNFQGWFNAAVWQENKREDRVELRISNKDIKHK